MTLSRLPEGVAAPFADLPAEKQAELLGWVRSERERKLREDPVIFVRLEYPDGSTVNQEVHELHRSECVRLNDDRQFRYMASQRARAEKLVAWEKAVADAKAETDRSFKTLKKQSQEASSAEIFLSDSKELLAYRRAHVAEVTPPEPRIPRKPDVSYGDHDALWVQIQHSGIGAIRHD
jgi:hypothetical protein